MTAPERIFLHVSDIHFHFAWSGTSWDIDETLRNALEYDVQEIANRFARVDGILLCGDVAFSGAESEYKVADEWLARLASLVKCPPDNVFVVPGNHDVNRDVHEASPFILDLHRKVLANLATADDRMAAILQNELNGDALLASLRNYRAFATRFNCFTTRVSLSWEKLLILNTKVTIRFSGLNSAVFSTAKDGRIARNQLFVGELQAASKLERGILNVCMCHHPPNWLADQASFDAWTLAPGRAPIQLFGHEHAFRIREENGCLRIHSGAIQPSRREEGWLPRYNFLRFSVEEEDSTAVAVEIWPRSWDSSLKRFACDSEHCNEDDRFVWNYIVDSVPPSVQGSVQEILGARQTTDDREVTKLKAPEVDLEDAKIEVISSFLTLPYHEIHRAANRLGLVRDDDASFEEDEVYRRYIERIEANNGFHDLWIAVREAEGRPTTSSPFDAVSN